MSGPSTAALFVMPRVIRIVRLPAVWTTATDITATAIVKASGRKVTLAVQRVASLSDAVDLHVPMAAFPPDPDSLQISLRAADGAALSLSVAVGPTVSVGSVDLFHASRIIGWCSQLAPGQSLDRSKLTLSIDDQPQAISARECLRQDLVAGSFCDGNEGFAFLMPPQLFDGAPHTIKVAFDGKILAQQRSKFQYGFELLRLARDGERLLGRARITGTAIDNLELALMGGSHLFSLAKPVPAGTPDEYEFGFDLPNLHDRVLCDLVITPRFVPRGILVRLGEQPLFALPTQRLRQLAGLIRGLPEVDDEARTQLVSEMVLPRLAFARRCEVIARPKRDAAERSLSPVAVVIPVYDGIETTRDCLASVHQAGVPSGARVVVVADRPPDPEMMTMLRRDCPRFGFELIENAQNQGFVATCNAAMAAAGRDDVVLLNSDTIVAAGWLDRLRAAAARSDDIASVTPFSNNATILSYPLPHVASPTTAAEVMRLDRLFATHNAGTVVDIPTGVGFCMYMRRTAIDDVGAFDAVWGAGYGEENDWCMRAADRGWRHVIAADVFVGHVGGMSFGATTAARMKSNGALLDARYPDYRRLVQDFIAEDPLWQVRLEVDMARLATEPKPLVLHVEHGRGGGLETHVERLAAQLAARGVRSLRLRPRRSPNEKPGYRILGEDPPLDMTFPSEHLNAVVYRLRGLGLCDVHIHSSLNLPPADIHLLVRSGPPVTMTFHDYGAICPRVSLTGAGGRYCGEPDIAACETCVKTLGAHPVVDRFQERFGTVAAWRQHTAAIIAGATRLLAPSADCAARLQRHLGQKLIEVVGGLDPVPANYRLRRRAAAQRLRVGILGAISADKGLNELKSIVARAVQRDLECDFVVIGFTADDGGLMALGTTRTTVTIGGRYGSEQVADLLRIADLDYGLLLSVAPETYCYTLSEYWAAGVPVLAFDLGAPADRIRSTGAGVLVAVDATADEILEKLLEARQQFHRLPQAFTEASPALSAIEGYAALRTLSSVEGSDRSVTGG